MAVEVLYRPLFRFDCNIGDAEKEGFMTWHLDVLLVLENLCFKFLRIFFALVEVLECITLGPEFRVEFCHHGVQPVPLILQSCHLLVALPEIIIMTLFVFDVVVDDEHEQPEGIIVGVDSRGWL